MRKTEQDFKDRIPKEGKIVIYGAGAYGRLIYRWLSDAGMRSRILAFAVTSISGNAEAIEGLPVKCIDLFNQQNVFVILAVNETIQGEMKEKLENIGLPYAAVTQELLDSVTSTHTPRREVFICLSYYHVLCAVVHAIKNSNNLKTDIVFGDSLPEYQKLSTNLVESQIFSNVYCFAPISEYKTDNVFLKFFMHKRNARIVEQELTLDFSRYQRVYVFNDYMTLGRYLQDKRIHYTVLEDGCNFFQIVGEHFLGFLVPERTGIGYKIRKRLNYGYFYLGQSKYCDEIWVNEAKDLVIPLSKVVEKPMCKMLHSITETEGKRILKVFNGEGSADILDDDYKDRVLILTQPYHKDGTVKSLAAQKKIYSDLVAKKLAEGKKVYLKVHPRDDTSYDDLNATILYKYMPIEVFSFAQKMYFEEVIAVSSTAVYNCDYAEKKTLLGLNYIENHSSELR